MSNEPAAARPDRAEQDARGREPGRQDPRRSVPRTDRVLADPQFDAARESLGADLLKGAVTHALDMVRSGELPAAQLFDHVLDSLPATASSLLPVVNATGVIVHTNLGRAPLSRAAVNAVVAATGATNVEFEAATGSRGRRGGGALDALAAAVPAAEAVHVVNNGAAALVLAATALAADQEIVVSRGEMVEIGDGFRLPDLLVSTGARLREVGTTNRTSLRDYLDAVGPTTGFVLKVHPSNFVVRGFTASVPVGELAAPLAARGIRLVADLGSGLLGRHRALPNEPDAATALADGADLVTGSGDKLLGGPQAGLLLGRRDLVERLRRHPLARALRVDKMTLAALEATLRGPTVPVVEALEADVAQVRDRATRLAAALAREGIDADVVDCDATVGGGGAPGLVLPSAALRLPLGWVDRLRQASPPVVGRVEHGALLLDLRSVPADQDETLLSCVLAARP